ncbi:hypothetical protein FQN55_006911 [Onygenales sp. PD_40]|nr:hypothetical protein FQN55_006911 [Onygenales sp. PD_40]KAK2762013.1 hypothetical protein FQN53_007597 [Emmonsiellopsis sp. PD_33]
MAGHYGKRIYRTTKGELALEATDDPGFLGTCEHAVDLNSGPGTEAAPSSTNLEELITKTGSIGGVLLGTACPGVYHWIAWCTDSSLDENIVQSSKVLWE